MSPRLSALLLSFALTGCYGWHALELPEEPDAKTLVLEVSSESYRKVTVYDLAAGPPPELRLSLLSDSALHMRAFHYPEAPSTIGLPLGTLLPTAETEGADSLPDQATAYELEREPQADYESRWQRVGEVTPLQGQRFVGLGQPSDRCRFEQHSQQLPSMPDATTFIVPAGDHALVGTGNWKLFEVWPDQTRTRQVTLPGAPTTNAAFLDSHGRLWIGGIDGQLTRLDPADPEGTATAIAPSILGVGWIVAMSGGDVGTGVQLVALTHLNKLLFLDEDSSRWRVIDLGAELQDCEGDHYALCKLRRVAWVGPDEAIMTGRGNWLGHYGAGRYQLESVVGCENYSTVDVQPGAGPIVVCQRTGKEFWTRFDQRAEGEKVTPGLKLQTSYDTAHVGGAMLLAGGAGNLSQRGRGYKCDDTSLGIDDLAMIAPIGDRDAAIIVFFLSDVSANPGQAPMTVHWLRWDKTP